MSSTRVGAGVRNPRDFYRTPLDCIRPLAEELHIHFRHARGYQLLDAGAGDGRIGRTVAGIIGQREMHHTAIEDDERHLGELLAMREWGADAVITHDFLEYRPPSARFHLVVSNPPYSLAAEFIEHGLGLLAPDGVAAFLVNMHALGSLKRLEMWQANPPSFMRVLVPRPSFTVDGATDSTEYAWVGWRPAWSMTGKPAIGWYDRRVYRMEGDDDFDR